MIDFDKKLIEKKRLQCDLIEIGVTRAVGLLVKESMDIVDDDAMTLQNARELSNKLNKLIGAFDDAVASVKNYTQYAEQYEKDIKNESETEVGNA